MRTWTNSIDRSPSIGLRTHDGTIGDCSGKRTLDDNPFQAPSSPTDVKPDSRPRLPLRSMLVVVMIGICGGVSLGCATNCINGAVSPGYFQDHILYWRFDHNIWLSSVLQGIAEGAIYGVIYAVIFLGLLWALAGMRCTQSAAVACTRYCFGFGAGMWLVGGVCAAGYAVLFPYHCPARYFGSHHSLESLVRYAWVRGTIWGIVYGSIVPVFGVAFHFAAQKHRSSEEESAVKMEQRT